MKASSEQATIFRDTMEISGEDGKFEAIEETPQGVICSNGTFVDGSFCFSNYTADASNSTQHELFINSTELPKSLSFDQSAKKDIIAYSVLFVIAAVGNLTVFFTLFRNRHWKSRVNLMIMHLAAADLMVTFIMIPLEVGWRITTQWVAGNPACKVFQFLRAFGLYLSSTVLVCISLDRYFAILHPLKVNDAQRRGKLMLGFAWTTAAVCSLPQSVIFHVAPHPVYSSFKQCVTFGFFENHVQEMAYNLFCLSVMYFLPLFIIIVVYVRILWEISQKSKDSREECRNNERGQTGGPRYRLRLRRSDMTNIERARARTLRMTIIIVLAFIWCWTPYVVMVLWYMFDRDSAEKLDKGLQDALFIMAVSNSCVNPLVYGTYNLNLKNELSRCFGHKKTPQQLVRRPTASTALRTQASNVFNSSISSRHTLHTKVLDSSGCCSRSTRLSFSPADPIAPISKPEPDHEVSIPSVHLRQETSFDKKDFLADLESSESNQDSYRDSHVSLSLRTLANNSASFSGMRGRSTQELFGESVSYESDVPGMRRRSPQELFKGSASKESDMQNDSYLLRSSTRNIHGKSNCEDEGFSEHSFGNRLEGFDGKLRSNKLSSETKFTSNDGMTTTPNIVSMKRKPTCNKEP